MENTFTNNLVIRTKPQKSPAVIAGLIRGLTAKDNVIFEASAKGDEPWMQWFRRETSHPQVNTPKPLTAADVGPEAP